jgi:hypothetical protein
MAHGVHTFVPFVGVYLPASQSTQWSCPVAAFAFPTGHSSHEADPGTI